MKLLADTALLPHGWTDHVLITIDPTGIISAVEPSINRKNTCYDETVKILMPGFVNGHSHCFQRAFAGLTERHYQDKDDFWSWREQMYRFVQLLNPDDLNTIARKLYLDLLKHGYTSVAEFHYLHHDTKGHPYSNPGVMSEAIIEAAASVNISLTLLPVLYNASQFNGQAPLPNQKRFIHTSEQFYRLFTQLQSLVAKHPLVTLGVAPHSLRAVSPDSFQHTLKALQNLNPHIPIHIHISEQQKEVRDCIAHYGTTPIQWLLEHVVVDQHWSLIHATHATPEEINRLHAVGAHIGVCPSTEANLGDGIISQDALTSERAKFFIGSDSHVSLNPFHELRLLEYGQRLLVRRRNVLVAKPYTSTGDYLLHKVLTAGATACHQPIGAIEVGKRADLLSLDKQHSHLNHCSIQDYSNTLIFVQDDNTVKSVMVAGRWVVKDGHHDHEQIIDEHYKKLMLRLRKAP